MMKSRVQVSNLAILFFVLVFVMSSCSSYIHISEINDRPQDYRNKQVSIKGKVVETLSIPFVQKGMYQMDDGTDKIWIVPQGRVPFRGEKVKVKGEVKTGFTIPVLKRTFGVIVAEEKER